MSFQPLKVAAPVHDFVDPRLKKENREKSRHEHPQKVCCSIGGMQIWHPAIVARSRGLRGRTKRPLRDRFRSRRSKGRNASKQMTTVNRGLVYSILSDAPHRIPRDSPRRRSRQCHLSCRARTSPHRGRDQEGPARPACSSRCKRRPNHLSLSSVKQNCIFPKKNDTILSFQTSSSLAFFYLPRPEGENTGK